VPWSHQSIHKIYKVIFIFYFIYLIFRPIKITVMKQTCTSFLLFGLLLMVCSCEQASTSNNSSSKAQNKVELKGQSAVKDDVSDSNILKIAMGSKDHTTLVAAIQAAGLEDVLSNAGPLTVFAPNNAAFDKLPEGTLEDLLKPENKATLANIITYHAAPGSYTGDFIKGVMGIGQATGDKVKVEVNEAGETTVNGAKVLGTVKASNGYVHVIDQVLLPPEK
jgi:uncharacterized surface protein with fasciclin (FAS1) repeats